MARKLNLGGFSKIGLDEKLDLICNFLIPGVYLRALSKGNGELKRVRLYEKLAKKEILNSRKISREEKFYLLEDLKAFINFYLEEEQIGGYYNRKNFLNKFNFL